MDFAGLQGIASSMITMFGQAGALRVPGTPTGEAWNQSPGATTDIPVTLAAIPYSSKEIDGTLILATDVHVYLAATALEVEPQASAHQMIIAGIAYQIIVPVKRLAPAGTVLFFECQCRL